MKANRLLIAAILFFAAAVANFCLAITGYNFVNRISGGIIFSVCMFLALRERNKQRESNDE